MQHAFHWQRNSSTSKYMKSLNWIRNLTISYQTISMVLLLVALHHHVNYLDPHQLWNLLFHSFHSLSPPSLNFMDDLPDTNSNTCIQDELAYGNACKTIASSFQQGFLCLWISTSFALKFSWAWLSSSNILKHYGYTNHKRNVQIFSKSYVRIFHVYHNQKQLD